MPECCSGWRAWGRIEEPPLEETKVNGADGSFAIGCPLYAAKRAENCLVESNY